jgi:NTP pyrophosphatase (non-canonical NTP hydrolase)
MAGMVVRNNRQIQGTATFNQSGTTMSTTISYREIELEVIRWAEARKIIPNATPQAQLNKALEEMAELFKAESQQNMDGIKDGVGDVVVCLINYCALKDIDLVQCLIGAYQEIKDRKGTLLPDGTFVKEDAPC